ncbi:ABC transporter permease [Pinisolibacter aquiterrae]|uniref:ABC transporter permease n=1 Tax=Pinisolibacter aquiterrae TaxID=2815579 RepID=UPI001C3D020E|nr:ABC transporter permease subunit [Pinisolibacter aquiterrae]MBV5263469.1 ABC transporter permease subunit [Pinisolibacter aquiterrae]MCC8237454.1 ABC transporter permease subunit [Pinisolibacter aquiterrae]
MSTEKSRSGRFLLVGIPYAWMLVFFLVPFLIVAKISLSTSVMALPPYAPVVESLTDLWRKIGEFSFFNYLRLVQESIYVESYLSSLWIAFSSTVIMLFIAYPLAYGMARAPKAWRPTLLMLVILPFWTSFLIRVYAWIGILADEGLLNWLLVSLRVVDEPITFLATQRAVYIGIIYSYLPFMVLPLYSSLEKMDETLLEAAQDLGCTSFQAFWRVTFPLSIPGVIAGSFLVFIPAVGEFVIPDLLGGSDTVMIGKTLWEEFFNNRDWPAASAVAITLLLLLVVPIVIFQNAQAKAQEAGR